PDALCQDGLLALGEPPLLVLLFELLELGFQLALPLQRLYPALTEVVLRSLPGPRELRFELLLLLSVALLGLLLLQLGVAALELHLALDGRHALDEPKHRRLVHLRARERLVRDDGHVELAALEPRP